MAYNLARLKPLYVSLSKRNNGIDDGTYQTSIDNFNNIYAGLGGPNLNAAVLVASTVVEDTIPAQVDITFNDPIVDKMSDYLVCIERMELTFNGIPFYDPTDNTVSRIIRLRSRINFALTTTCFLASPVYSLDHLFDELNQLTFPNPNAGGLGQPANLQMLFSIDSVGFIRMECTNLVLAYSDFQIEFPRMLNQILGIPIEQQIPGASIAYSNYPRIDCGDNLDHIMLKSNLPTYSDSLGNVRVNILTDFAPDTSYSNNMVYQPDRTLTQNSFSTNTRQKGLYTPPQRRFMDLQGSFPLVQINIEANYVNPDGLLRPIMLPFGGSFEIKLGFYRKQ